MAEAEGDWTGLKAGGNSAFASGRFEDAISDYSKALRISGLPQVCVAEQSSKWRAYLPTTGSLFEP
jgi:hypothetical protein